MARWFWQYLAAASPSSRLKVFFLRLSGARIGSHVRIRRGSYVFADDITIGDGVILEPDVHIVCSKLEMGVEAKIDSETVVYGGGALTMADGAYIGPRAWINPEATVRLGRNTGVGPGSSVFTHGVWLPYVAGFPRRFADVTLGDGVWVPGNVTILPGVTIGDGAMVGAGAVVTKDVEPEAFVAGVPAKAAGKVADFLAPQDRGSRDARAREMLDAFPDFATDQGWRIQRNVPPFLYVFGKRGPRTGVLYVRDVATLETSTTVERTRGRARRVIVVFLDGFDADARARLRGLDGVDWFDLAASSARRSWDRDTVAFRRYLASHWGMRFALTEG